MKLYFCLWFDESEKMNEEFFDHMLDALDCARSCNASGYVYYWGETQAGEDTHGTSK